MFTNMYGYRPTYICIYIYISGTFRAVQCKTVQFGIQLHVSVQIRATQNPIARFPCKSVQRRFWSGPCNAAQRAFTSSPCSHVQDWPTTVTCHAG